MIRGTRRLASASTLAVLAVVASADSNLTRHVPDGDDVGHRLGSLRVPFVANAGQADERIAYYAPTFAGTLFVTREGQLVYSLRAGRPKERGQRTPGARWSLTETFAGGRAVPVAGARAVTTVSEIRGADPARSRTLPTYADVSLGHVWPGVDVSLRAHGASVEKIFTVEPGAPVDRIRVRVDGVEDLTVSADGTLIARIGLGPVTFSAPIAYQVDAGRRRPVTVAYASQGREYGFTVGDYDRARPLVIDPMLQSTYLGVSLGAGAEAIAIHPFSGDVYVSGGFDSATIPDSSDAFVARLNAALTTLLHITYLIGSGDDLAGSVAIHPASGDVYVSGFTSSDDFPKTSGGAQPTIPAPGFFFNGFVARLDAALGLVQATYLGGAGGGNAHRVAVHPATGEIYVAGSTDSGDFLNTAGGAQPVFGGGFGDGYVARLNPTLTIVRQATYVGGGDSDSLVSLAIDATTGDVYAVGSSTSTDLPGTAGSAQPALAGFLNSFVVRLNAALTQRRRATYLGGTQFEIPTDLALHPTTGDVYVTGATGSPDFPGTAGGAQPAAGNGFTGYVARLDGALTTLRQATYLGGTSSEFPLALAIHPRRGDVYVAGNTFSSDFPGTAGGVQPTFAGGVADGFVARLDHALTTLAQATYLGGTGFETSASLAFDRPGVLLYFAGTTSSTDFPGTAGGAQPTNPSADTSAAFVARLTPSLRAADAIPTLSEWAQIALVSVLLAVGLATLKRRLRAD
jgi:hypothetical protein